MFENIWRFLLSIFGTLGLFLLWPATGHAQVVFQDNFETGATGWSNNSNETNANFTRYLGRFDNSPNQTSRTFAVPAGSGSLVIAFDFYRFDSWDDTAQFGFDRFQVDVAGVQIFSLPFAPAPPSLTGSNGNASWVFAPFGPSNNQAHGNFPDQRFRVTITITNPPTSVPFTLRTAVNQGGNDESGGFDNFRVEAFPRLPSVAITKTSAPETAGAFHLPGTRVIYTINVTSTGGPLDTASLRLTDLLPPEVTLFTGNFGAAGPVSFTDLSTPASGVTCCTPANLSFSDDTAPPLLFNYTPNGGDDPAVTAIQIVPGGQARQGVTSPVQLRFQLRATIK